jgi:hypothetical protein
VATVANITKQLQREREREKKNKECDVLWWNAGNFIHTCNAKNLGGRRKKFLLKLNVGIF